MTNESTPSGFRTRMLSLTPVQKALTWLKSIHRCEEPDAHRWRNAKRTQDIIERGEKIELILKRVLNEHGIDCENCKADAEKVLKPLASSQEIEHRAIGMCNCCDTDPCECEK